MTDLKIRETSIPGLLVIDLPMHGSDQSWLKINWNHTKLTAAGMPEFSPVQNSVIFSTDKGATRGIHAEPWDKYISVGHGRVFVAIVDLRPGETFGVVEALEVGVGQALFVPRNCGNSFQMLEDNTVYSLFQNVDWSADAVCTFVTPADTELNIPWPIPLDSVELSEKDKGHPTLQEVRRQLGA